jgi:flagellar protein FlaI
MAEAQVVNRRILRIFKVHEPYGHVALTEDPETHETMYEVVEPTITKEEEKWLSTVRNFLIEQINVTMSELGSEEEAEKYLRNHVIRIVKDFHIPVNKYSLEKILYYIIRDYVGYGNIDVMMRDPLIEDISCNGVDVPIFVWHREYESIPSNVSFPFEEGLDSFIIRLAYRTGRMISIASPILDSILPDGSRIQMTLGRSVTRHGSTFTIRKFKADPLTIVDLIKFNTLSSQMAAIYWYLIENKFNVFVCGPTASGKTTTLNCLICFIQPDLKIVTIEDTPELQLYHKNWIRSVARPGYGGSAEVTLFDLLRAAMRQRPDYIIVGEVRGAEAYTLFQAMATGHGGVSSLHAESVAAAIHRLETEPMNIPRTLITGLNVINVQERIEVEGKPARRTVTSTEIVGLDPRTNEIITNEIFKYQASDDSYHYSGRSYHLEKIARDLGRRTSDVTDDVARRQSVLEWMAKNNIRSFSEVTDLIRRFYANPEEVYKTVKVEV